MHRKILWTMTVACLALVVGAAWPAQAQDAKTAYPRMAPFEQYLIADRNAEIAMARTAAPESISRAAEVMVLGRYGYETVAKAKNGFLFTVDHHRAPALASPD